MNRGSSEQVRAMAVERYIVPALHSGRTEFSIAVKDLMGDLVAQGFPPANTPQVCTALRKKEFLREHGLEIDGIDGPPSKMSTTVVVRYRVAKPLDPSNAIEAPANTDAKAVEETPEVRARRLTEKLRGLLKDELAEYGGSEAFLRWVRGYDEENAA